VAHMLNAWAHALGGGLAAFFTGEIDDYRQPGFSAWCHAVAAMVAVLFLVWRERAALIASAKAVSWSGQRAVPLTPAVMPVLFVILYLGMYGAARFSLPVYRTPRYFLPLCPFLSMAMAVVVMRLPKGLWKTGGVVLIGLLVLRGAWVSTAIGMRPWHEEHRIRTSGQAIRQLAGALSERNIALVYTPYEIQWRLMFETDEKIFASCKGLSPLPRYAPYSNEFMERVKNGESFALIARRDFAFMDLARGQRGDGSTERSLRAALDQAGFASTEQPMESEEFLVFWPLDRRLFGGAGRGE